MVAASCCRRPVTKQLLLLKHKKNMSLGEECDLV